jgi:hypothetical protein
MNKVDNFIKTHFHYIALSFFVINMFQSCNRDVKSLSKKIDKLESSIDTLKTVSVTKKDLTIEGLKTEKRMIQSTDRKILDVNRQTSIDNELKDLIK